MPKSEVIKPPVLLIFIKNPIAGKTKTRLAATVGNDEALRIYDLLLQHTRNQAAQLEAKRLLYYSEFIDEEDDWEDTLFDKYVQWGDSLGKRMANAFDDAFSIGEKAIIIGSDCAELSTEILEDALAALDEKDFVVGPAKDGGYYLIGMSKFQPEVFENIEWSTDAVLPSTIERINTLNATYALLPTLSDVDTEADWDVVGWE